VVSVAVVVVMARIVFAVMLMYLFLGAIRNRVEYYAADIPGGNIL
jgi:hypothetical protein